jgi:hypothetical protein
MSDVQALIEPRSWEPAAALDPRSVIQYQLTGDASPAWADEFALLLESHGPKLADLLRSMADEGQRVPIQIEVSENRVIDGHHRILCALLLGVPLRVQYVRFVDRQREATNQGGNDE